MSFNDHTYDILKWMSTIFLPALAVFITTICHLYGLPYGEQIVGTIAAIATFIGTLIQISSHNYQGDGVLVVDTNNPQKDLYSIVIDDYPEVLAAKHMVNLKVEHQGE